MIIKWIFYQNYDCWHWSFFLKASKWLLDTLNYVQNNIQIYLSSSNYPTFIRCMCRVIGCFSVLHNYIYRICSSIWCLQCLSAVENVLNLKVQELVSIRYETSCQGLATAIAQVIVCLCVCVCGQARNKTGQVGYVPEKYLQFPTSNSLLSMLQSLATLDARSHTSSNSTEPELHSNCINGDANSECRFIVVPMKLNRLPGKSFTRLLLFDLHYWLPFIEVCFLSAA